jgi:hypothetical protein
MSLRYPSYKVLSAADLGFSAKLTSAAVTSSTFDASGFNRLTLYIKFIRAAGTGDLDFTLEAFDAAQNDWFPVQAVATATGVSTFTVNTLRKATGSASINYEIRFLDLQFHNLRLKSAAVTSSTTDNVTVTAELYRQGA